MEIHDRLTKVALGGEGQAGIAEVYELTDRPAAIEDRFGNMLAWAGPDRPDPYPKAHPVRRARLLDRAVTATVADQMAQVREELAAELGRTGPGSSPAG
jgi:hypothetical protein